MPITFQWDTPDKTVLRLTAEGTWNWNDFHKHLRRAQLWLDDAAHPVETIIDLSRGAKMPAGALGHLRSLGKQQHPNGTARVIVIGVDAALQTQMGAHDGVYQTAEQMIRFAADEDEAQQIIADWKQSYE